MFRDKLNLRTASGMVCAVVFSFTITTGGTALAASNDGTFAVRGLGATNCSQIVAELTGSQRDMASVQLSSWVAGYLSHANRATAGAYDVMPIQDVFGVSVIVARLCENNPDALIEPVMARVIELMAEEKQSAETDLMTVEAEGRGVQVRQAVLASAQRALIQRDLLPEGSDDGMFGPRTQTALAAFQTSIGLAESGLPDALTLFVLFEAN